MEMAGSSNVNVSNFVSVKLSGRSNYKIWKAQMLCLIKSQALLHYIVEAGCPSLADKGIHTQYDELVKGWIFGSVNEKVLKDLVDLGTAQEVWMKLEFLFSPTVSDTEGNSSSAPADVNEPVVSEIREDLKYIQALNVDVSNFVSQKLEGEINFYTWKTEILNLIGSHELLHIIHAKARFPWDEDDPITKKYDSLVRGWILSTMNDNLHNKYIMYRSVQLMWRNIESTLIDDSSYDKTKDLKYVDASNVDVSKFVLVKLSDDSNYSIWRAQMLYLLESYSLLHLLDPKRLYLGRYKYEKLVKDWIFRTMNDKLLKEDFQADDYVDSEAKDLWEKLECHFTKGYSRPEPVDSVSVQDLRYMQASNVNVSNFVSVKLFRDMYGRNNYDIWKAQMLCLIGSQKLLYVIDEEGHYTVDKYDTLVKGWILSAMDESTHNLVDRNKSGRDVWEKLKSLFDPPKSDRDGNGETSPGFEFRRMEFVRVSEVEDTDNIKIKKELYEAAVEGCWWKAKSILTNKKCAATTPIATNGNTILHFAVEMGHNYLVEKLLGFINDKKHIETRNYEGRTALHIAAVVGNIHAAELLILKTKQLLEIKDLFEELPFYIATDNMKVNMSTYLFKSTPESVSNAYPYHHKANALYDAIIAKQYDLAKTLIKEFGDAAMRKIMLMAITITFPSDLSFVESFIYPSFHDARRKTVVKDFYLLFHRDKCVDDILRIVKICSNTCGDWFEKQSMILFVLIATFYPIYQLICLLILVLRLTFSPLYFFVWKVLSVIVHPIKNIEKRKKEYQEVKEILSLICNQEGISNDVFKEPLFEAVRQDIYEVVDEILFASPAAINCKDDDGYNVIQLAIINRSEKVYNLINHIIERTNSYRTLKDFSENNLVHLVGRLAPSFVLGRTTGAALQLQQELLWREEVKKHLLPLELREHNIHKETPDMVFTKEHQDLMKQGETWIRRTAESCSITTALIVTIVFAAAITVPGGSNQESGIPVLKKEIAFTIFAVINAFSLFTATMALLLFLSVLTARFSEKDFLVSLPRRLIFGLFMLFLSTTTMIVAFCAILFIVFCDQRPWMLAPITGFACLPISVILTIKLPLVVDLIRSTYFPILGNKSYLRSCKINRKSTIFMK